jgi:hypothetical protein
MVSRLFCAGVLYGIAVMVLPACSSGDGNDNANEDVGPPNENTGTVYPPIESLTDGQWLSGDLHVHSEHSDDSTLNPIAKITALADSVGLQFLAITDHDNHVSGDVASHTWTDPDFQNSALIMLHSAEWTTHRGHGNPFSAQPYDHQRLYDARDDYDVEIGALVQELGVHLSANHPAASDHFGFSYDMVDSMEVWGSAIWADDNKRAVAIWDDMLKSGRAITARGGSDSHHGYPAEGETPSNNSFQAQANNVGTPTTWVFATDWSAQSVIDALDNGRASVSSNPYAPRVAFYADLDADGEPDMMMGDNTGATGEVVSFRVDLVGGPSVPTPYTVKVITDGSTLLELSIPPGERSVRFTDTPPTGQRKYYRVEVTGQQTPYPEVPVSAALSGNMIALSNPIYFNFDPAF